MKPGQMQDFAVKVPRTERHRRPVSCEEFGCQESREGFVLPLALEDDLTDVRAGVIRNGDRRVAEFICREGDVTAVDWGAVGSGEINVDALGRYMNHRVFAFPPGERCFREHVRVFDPVLQHARGFRMVPGGVGKVVDTRHDVRQVELPEFVERMNESAHQINEARRRG